MCTAVTQIAKLQNTIKAVSLTNRVKPPDFIADTICRRALEVRWAICVNYSLRCNAPWLELLYLSTECNILNLREVFIGYNNKRKNYELTLFIR